MICDKCLFLFAEREKAEQVLPPLKDCMRNQFNQIASTNWLRDQVMSSENRLDQWQIVFEEPLVVVPKNWADDILFKGIEEKYEDRILIIHSK